MKLKHLLLVYFTVCATHVSADSISLTNSSNSFGSGIFGTNRTRITSTEDTMTYYDQEQGRFIIVTNLRNNADLRVIITDLTHTPVKVFKVSDSSLIIPYNINFLDFYPSHNAKPGVLIIGTSRGDMIIDTFNLKSKFVIFNRDYFSGSSYETIPIQETKQIKGL